ncbi:MAG TPA: PAS domain-containing sensor histidine kinase [Bacteroides sp.]|nr:PAS domain-containing sensor histidine kinase [Bacteroides sp.]
MRVRTFLIVFTLLVVEGVALLVCRMWLGVAVSDYVLLADGVLLLGVLLLFRWQIVEPLHLMETGMLLLREQDFSSRLRRVGQTDADNIVDVFNRMMDALKAERLHVREQNQLFDLIFRSSPMGILILDLDRRVDSVNPSGERLLGVSLEAVRGKRLDECSFDLCEDLCSLAMDEVRTVRLTDSNIYRCSRQSFLNGGFRHTFYLVELLTEEVSQAERKAYEKVIRMIAHEVNNTVAGVTSTLDTLETAMEDMPDSVELCELMRVCIERCYNMGRFITNFADVVKIPDPILVHSDLNEVVRVNMQFLETMCGERRIALVMHLSPEPVWVDLDVVLFQQVLVNIFKNAVESIGQEGTVYIRTSAGSPVLEVADTGRGIDKETASKLFSPFFSTKPNGQGIGLMLVREVLMKHHCTFSLRTGDDGLTRFTIHFPFP